MAFSTLSPTASDYGAHQHFLTLYMDAYNARRSEGGLEGATEISEVWIGEARAEVLRDLQVALALNPDITADMEIIDELAGETDMGQRSRLRYVIALKQLELAFRDSSMGEGSENERLAGLYLKRYERERAGFAQLRRRQGRGARSTWIGL